MNFLEIHDQFYARVRKFILASVKNESATDDLLQEAFMKIQENLDSVRDPAKVSSWIFRVAPQPLPGPLSHPEKIVVTRGDP